MGKAHYEIWSRGKCLYKSVSRGLAMAYLAGVNPPEPEMKLVDSHDVILKIYTTEELEPLIRYRKEVAAHGQKETVED